MWKFSQKRDREARSDFQFGGQTSPQQFSKGMWVVVSSVWSHLQKAASLPATKPMDLCVHAAVSGQALQSCKLTGGCWTTALFFWGGSAPVAKTKHGRRSTAKRMLWCIWQGMLGLNNFLPTTGFSLLNHGKLFTFSRASQISQPMGEASSG